MTQRAATAALVQACKGYHAHLPLAAIFAATRRFAEPVDVDGEPWAGFLCGHNGRATIDLAGTKQCLQVQWYRMPSGRFEVNAYIA